MGSEETPVRLCNYVDVYKNDFITDDLSFMPGTATPKEIDAFRLRVGDVIITKDSEDRMDIGVPALVRSTADDLVCGYHLTMLRPDRHRVLGEYLFWALQTHPARGAFSNAAYGVTRYGLSVGAMKSIGIPVPDLETQKAIADFLDRETARIDALVEKKRQLVDLLQERLSSHLEQLLSYEQGTQTVFRRLIRRIEQGWSPDCEARKAEDDEFGVLKVGCVNGWKFDPSQHKALPKEMQPRMKLIISDGELLMSRANTPDLVGSATLVQGNPKNLLLCDKIYRIEIYTNLLDPRFAVMLLRSSRTRNHFLSSSNGASSSMQNISQHIVKTIPFSVPEMDQQVSRVHVFQKSLEATELLDQKQSASIDRLTELRASLITAAVKGQIDPANYRRHGTTDRALEKIEAEMAQ